MKRIRVEDYIAQHRAYQRQLRRVANMEKRSRQAKRQGDTNAEQLWQEANDEYWDTMWARVGRWFTDNE